jgi:hypothetical protein
MLLSAGAHLGSKNLQVHMEPYLWKTRPDGINVINIGKTWYEHFWNLGSFWREKDCILTFCLQGEDRPRSPNHRSCLLVPTVSALS